VELLRETPAVMAAFRELNPEARHWIAHHTGRTADGMAGYVERTDDDGWLELNNLEELQGYCYVVAGIVGEMLTELFLLDRPQLEPTADYLRHHASEFGEALQLVNILKDRASDAVEGRSYLPKGVSRQDVFTLARKDLEAASDYTEALRTHGAPRGVVEFCALPVLLAWGTLARVEDQGAGAKLTRPEVYAITEAMHRALDADQPVIPTAVRRSPIPSV
jgi:farnesyl-diphosphate farnesyltransferase